MFQSLMRSCSLLCIPALCGLALVGCSDAETGPELFPVTGTVSFEGKPLPEGDLILTPADGAGHNYAAKIVDGEFSLESTPGAKIVKVTARRSTGTFREDNPGERVEVTEQYIPPEFNEKSSLQKEVSPDRDNTLTLDL